MINQHILGESTIRDVVRNDEHRLYVVDIRIHVWTNGTVIKYPEVTIMENVSSILDVVKKNILIYYCVIDIKVWSFMSHEPLIIILLLLIIIFIIFSNRSLYTFHMFLAFYQLVALPANAVCCFYQTWNKAYLLSYHLIWVCLLVHTLLIYSLAQEHSANQL